MDIFKISVTLNEFGELRDLIRSVYGKGYTFDKYEMYMEYADRHHIEYDVDNLKSLIYAEDLDKVALHDILLSQYEMDITCESDRKEQILKEMKDYIDSLMTDEDDRSDINIKEFISYRKIYDLDSREILKIKDSISDEEVEKFNGISKENLILELISMYKYRGM